MIQFLFPRPLHFSKCIFISLSFKTQLASDNKFFKCITPNGFSFKLEVLILWESEMGYVLSGGDDKDFEPINNDLPCKIHLYIT